MDEGVIINRKYANHLVQINQLSDGYYQVGVDGWLVGCYEDLENAKFEAAEKIRQLLGWPILRVITLESVDKYANENSTE